MKQLPQLIIMLTGACLVVSGIVSIFEQDNRPSMDPNETSDLQASVSQFRVATHYVGIELIVVGAVFEIAGYLGTRPWASDKAKPG